jgi:GntR family L-lactate dehydrogenase operon transcriptional regulator
MRSLHSLLQKSVHYNLENLYQRPDNFKHLRDQHHHLMAAILEGNADGARAASDAHVDYVEKTLDALATQRQREDRANRRAAGLTAL